MKILSFGIRFGILLYFSLCWLVFVDKSSELQLLLFDRNLTGIYSTLYTSGMWSRERLVSITIHNLPSNVLQNDVLRKTIQELKLSERSRYRLQRWLHDHGLIHSLTAHPELLTGTLEHVIGHVSTTEDNFHRQWFHDEQEKLEMAMKEYQDVSNNVFFRLKNYDEELRSKSHHFTPRNLLDHFAEYPWIQLLKTVAYMLLLTAILSLMLSYSAYSDDITLIYFGVFLTCWFCPHFGSIYIYLFLVNYVWCHPFRTACEYILLEMWLFLYTILSIYNYSQVHIVILVMASLLCVSCVDALKFQPFIITSGKTNHDFKLMLTGTGNGNAMAIRFFKWNWINPIAKILFGLQTMSLYQWPKLVCLETIDVDLSWDVIYKIIQHAISVGNLRKLTIHNNYSMCESDLDSFINLITARNGSIEDMRISYDTNYSLPAILWHMLTCQRSRFVPITTMGVAKFLSRIKHINSGQLKYIAFYGISQTGELQKIQDLVKEIKTEKDITVKINLREKMPVLKESIILLCSHSITIAIASIAITMLQATLLSVKHIL